MVLLELLLYICFYAELHKRTRTSEGKHKYRIAGFVLAVLALSLSPSRYFVSLVGLVAGRVRR